jgi:DNA-binding CsgD family transcriptional regulator
VLATGNRTLSRRRSDLLGILDAAYRLDGSDDEWLQGIADAALPVLGRGYGVAAIRFHRPKDGVRQFVPAPACAGMEDGLRESIARSLSAVPHDRRERGLAIEPCATISESLGEGERFRQDPIAREFLHPYGVYDALWITSADPTGTCCALGIGLAEVTRTSAQEKRLYSRLGAHLTTALRLRQRLRTADGVDGADVVLRADGTVDQARETAMEPMALAALRAAAVAIDQSRGASAADVDEALSAWNALVSAEWSLVDQFDRGGRRLLIAYTNAPQTAARPGLTEKEQMVAEYAALGHSNKLIAYELGLAVPTVATYLKRAMNKLGAGTRIELIELLAKR